MPITSIPTLCKICDEHCGILVTDEGGRLSIKGNRAHPVSKGFVCVKGKNYGEVHYSPLRLSRPLLKKKSGWEEISFEDALEVIASRFLRSEEEFGPESVVFYKGEGLKHFEVADYMRHLANSFGSPNYVSVGSLCHFAQVLGHSLTYGGKPVPDFDKTGVVLLWGTNPAVSFPRTFSDIRAAIRRGTKLVVVDPTVTETAKLAHVHLRVRPGSDGMLALALIKSAIEDRGFVPVDDFVEGWDGLVELVQRHSYRELLIETDITDADFQKARSLIFDNLPGWTKVGLGLEHRPGGVQTIRAAACLQSILDPTNRPAHLAARLQPLPKVDRYPAMKGPIGAAEYPMVTGKRREGHGMVWGRAVLDRDPYPVRSMLIAGGNPMVTFPAASTQASIFQALDFLVVFDLFMTATARLADLVFPAADHLDNLELHDYGRIGKPILGLMRPATSSPKGWPTWKLIFAIARRLGVGDFFPWKDNREAIDYRLLGSGVTVDDLEGGASATAAYTYQKHADNRWHTQDGKVHYSSATLAGTGNEALPVPEAMSLPHEADELFPFWLSIGDRIAAFQHGQFREVPAYARLGPGPMAEIHPQAARDAGIGAGDLVRLSTKYGSIEVQAHLNANIRRDCLSMPHGWERPNANELTGIVPLDRISGFPWFKALPARIERTGS